MNIDNKRIGYSLIAFSIVLLIALIIVKVDFDKQSAFLCEQFDKNELDMAGCPAHKTSASWVLVLAFVIDFLILATGIYLAFLSKPIEAKKEFKHIDQSKLDDEEKNIYTIIKNKGGSAYQTDLIKETGFSKVKITRILDKLENMDILERKRRGMTNIIVLK